MTLLTLAVSTPALRWARLHWFAVADKVLSPVPTGQLSVGHGGTRPYRDTLLAMQRDVEKVEEIYRAYAKRQVNAVLMHLSKEVEIIQSSELPWGGQYMGHEGARQFLTALGEQLEARLLLERLIDAGDRVVAVGRTVGKTRATQLEFDVPVVHIWTFHQGQVVRWEAYLDNATMLAALGIL